MEAPLRQGLALLLPGRRADRRLFWSALPPLQAGLLAAAALSEEAPLPGGLLLLLGGWVWAVLHGNRLRDAGRGAAPGWMLLPPVMAGSLALSALLSLLLGAPPRGGLTGAMLGAAGGGAGLWWLVALLLGPCLLASALCGLAREGGE